MRTCGRGVDQEIGGEAEAGEQICRAASLKDEARRAGECGSFSVNCNLNDGYVTTCDDDNLELESEAQAALGFRD